MLIEEARKLNSKELEEYLNNCLLFGIEPFSNAAVQINKDINEVRVELLRDENYQDINIIKKKIVIPEIFNIYGVDIGGIKYTGISALDWEETPYLRELDINQCKKVKAEAFTHMNIRKLVIKNATSYESLEEESFCFSDIKELYIDNLERYKGNPFKLGEILNLHMKSLKEVELTTLLYNNVHNLYADSLKKITVDREFVERERGIVSAVIHLPKPKIRIEVVNNIMKREPPYIKEYYCRKGRDSYELRTEDMYRIYREAGMKV